MEKINVTCRLSATDVAFLDELADAMERDRSYLIKKAVAEYIALHRWQIDEVRKGMAELANGEFATEKEVKATFKELRG
jgi:predicted transcriptional regulator